MKTIGNRIMTMSLAASVALVAGCAHKRDVATPLTAPLDAAAWQSSQWISAPDAPVVTGRVEDYVNSRAADGASWFTTTITNGKKVVSARWMTTGLGVYDLYVNGHTVGREVLKPGFTHFEKTKRSFTYDITSLIDTRPGAVNLLAAQVTPGWWADKIVTPWGHEGMRGRKCAFRGVLQLTFADGTTQLCGTGPDGWKAGISGPVRHAAIFDGEEYDARQPMGYEGDAVALQPEVNSEFHGEILPTDGAEVYLRPDLTLHPTRAYVWKDVIGATADEYGKVVISREYADGDMMTIMPGETLVVDFGQNSAAIPSFVFKDGTTRTVDYNGQRTEITFSKHV